MYKISPIIFENEKQQHILDISDFNVTHIQVNPLTVTVFVFFV